MTISMRVCAAINPGQPLRLQCGVFNKIYADRAQGESARSVPAASSSTGARPGSKPISFPMAGVKDSSIVREGPRYAIRYLTEERLVVFNA